MKCISQLLGLAAFACALSLRAEAGATLLKNGDFAKTSGATPQEWKVTAPGQEVAIDKTEHPKDQEHSLKVAIKKAADSQGSIAQVIKNPPKNAKMVLSAYIKGSANRLGYLNVKLKAAGKELSRQKTAWNAPEWDQQKLEFSTGEADEITIECRFSQSEKAVGQSVWFADVKLAEAK